MKPPVSILSKAFKYTPSASTNLRATFARVRREQKQAAATPVELPGKRVVVALLPKSKAKA